MVFHAFADPPTRSDPVTATKAKSTSAFFIEIPTLRVIDKSRECRTRMSESPPRKSSLSGTFRGTDSNLRERLEGRLALAAVA